MRILHIAQHHELLGGAEVHRENVIRGLADRGHENAFFGGSDRTAINTPERRVLLRPAWDSQTLVHDESLARQLWHFATEFRPDVVHVHHAPYLPTELYRQLSELGVPLVQTAYDYGLLCTNSWGVTGDGDPCSLGPGAKCFEHGCTRNFPFSAAGVWTAKRRLDMVRESVDVVVCPTEHMRAKLEEQGLGRVVVLPYFPAAREVQPRPLRERERRRLLVVARLVREKGVAHAIEAFAEVLRRVPDAELEIVGSGGELGALRMLAERLRVEHAVRFMGHLGTDETTERISRSAALLLPSIWMEALPLISFDAHATGTPLVGNRIGGIPEAIEEGVDGHLVDASDARAFADVLERVLTDDVHWQSLSVAARQRFQGYDEVRHINGLEEVYRVALGAHRPVAADVFDGPDDAVIHDELIRHIGQVEGQLAEVRRGLTGKVYKVERLLRAMVESVAQTAGRLLGRGARGTTGGPEALAGSGGDGKRGSRRRA